MLTMFWQYIAGLSFRLFWRVDRRLADLRPVQVGLGRVELPLASSTISSFSGTSAVMPGWFLAASSSSSAWEVVGVLLLARSGAMNGVQPSAGSMNSSIRVLSLPLTSSVEPGQVGRVGRGVLRGLAGGRVEQVTVVTLSLWSWSIMSKLRTRAGVARPEPAGRHDLRRVPSDGTNSLPSRISRSAVLKKLMPLQNDTWPKIDPRPLTQLPCAARWALRRPGSGPCR